jgi:hypothetical protein
MFLYINYNEKILENIRKYLLNLALSGEIGKSCFSIFQIEKTYYLNIIFYFPFNILLIGPKNRYKDLCVRVISIILIYYKINKYNNFFFNSNKQQYNVSTNKQRSSFRDKSLMKRC